MVRAAMMTVTSRDEVWFVLAGAKWGRARALVDQTKSRGFHLDLYDLFLKQQKIETVEVVKSDDNNKMKPNIIYMDLQRDATRGPFSVDDGMDRQQMDG